MGLTFRGGEIQQKGKGIGGFFRGLINIIKPVAKTLGKNVVKVATSDTAKSVAKTLGEQALDSALNITKDVLNGNDLQESFEKEGGNIKRKASDAISAVQSKRARVQLPPKTKSGSHQRLVSKKSGLEYMKKKYRR